MKIKKKHAIGFMLFCFVGIIATIWLMLDWKQDVSTNLHIKQNIDKIINIKEEKSINFKKLKQINPDTVGYIKVPNTNVDYVVVKGTDNDYYLKHDFNKEDNIAGWIFTDYKNKVDGTDKNLVIFGHDTADGSMFGSLASLLNEDNIQNENNLIIDFITEKSKKKYKIFSIYTIKPEEYYIKTDFKENEFERFKGKIKERSIYKLDANIKHKNIITLSTCQNYGVKRLAIHAVEI